MNYKDDSNITIPGKLLDHVEDNEGSIVLYYHRDQWYISYQYGREAEDSNMIGGEAIGAASTAREALNQIREQLKI